MIDGIWNDVRLAFRQLSKSKGFTITAVLTLALGIGANSAVFTLLHAILVKSLPVADPQSLVRLGDSYNCCVIGGLQSRFSIYSHPLYLHLRDHASGFEEMAAFQAGSGKVGVRRSGGAQASEPFVDQFVSGNYFSMFGLQPFAGRLLTAADDTRGAPPVAVMSFRVWQQRYSGDSSVIGSTFIIDGAPYTIAGIAPPGFFGATVRPDPPDFWMPLATEPLVRQGNSLLDRAQDYWLYIIGRMKPGTQTGSVEPQVNTLLKQWLIDHETIATDADRRGLERVHLTVVPAGGGVASMKENYERDLNLLTAITGLVLLIACANLANLQLARGAANHRQTSIRVALGAPRLRLVRQVLTESLILAAAGGAAGLFIAMELAGLLLRVTFQSSSYVPIETNPSLPVLGFTFALSLITGLVFGVAPAWSSSRADPAAALQGAGRSTRHTTLPQRSLVVVQAALSLVLLAAAGLMVQTLRNLESQQFGFQREGTIVVNVNAGFGGYSPEKLATTYNDIERRMRQIPGVQEAGLALYTPMSGDNWQSGVTFEDQPNQGVSPAWDRVSPGFFTALGFHVLRGRILNELDLPDSTHVTVVNQAFADKFYPNADPLGKRFGLGGTERRADYEIVGVVNNVVFRNPRQPVPPPMFFLPLLQMRKSEWQDAGRARSNLIHSIVLRVAGGNHPSLTAGIQRALAAVDQNLTILNVATLDEQLGNQLNHERMLARLAGMFGVLALLLASIGLYGLTAYSLAQRTMEIGIRTALGASKQKIIQLILSRALGQIGIGLAIGLPAALGAGRVLAGQLYGVNASDPLVLGGSALVLAMAATAAGLVPAWRASRIDPVQALRK